ncbi:hypothetical protein ACHAXT_013232 [Thalassiosira profunda]
MSDEPQSSGGSVVIEMAELAPAADGRGRGEAPDVDGEATTPAPPPSLHRDRSDLPWTTSTAMSREERDEEFDRDMLHRAIADTGRWAYGTISVEAWVLDQNTGKLIRPKRAFWFDPVAVRGQQDNEALMRLVDPSREGFVSPDPLAPGVGLAGALWSELSDRTLFPAHGRRGHRRHNRTLSFGNVVADATGERHVAWREVEPISLDPDQPFNLRLKMAVQAGIGLAAGVKFDFRGQQGLVVYMARGTTDVEKLKSETNEQYLLSAAEVIGSIVCLRGARRRCLAERRAEREAAVRRVRHKMVAVIRLGGSFLKKSLETSEPVDVTAKPKPSLDEAGAKRSRGQRVWSFLVRRSKVLPAKWRGANNEPPPPFSTRESLWTFLGCFLTLVALLTFSEAIERTNQDYSLVLGPFGALMTLQYSLTAAPASQPRNAILGQAVSISIALLLNYTRTLSVVVKRSLGTALSIMLMARLGVTHPPAGAAALIYTGGGYDWVHMGISLAGNVVAILFAVVINDLNVKRQYPTSWGFGYWRKHVFNCNAGESKKN